MPPHIDNIAQSDQHTDQHIAPGSPRFNAVKHGLYSDEVLLPGEDAAAFQRHRLGLFHLYRPQTRPEAEAVEALAECQWLRRRYRPLQTQFDRQAVTPEKDVAGRVCEPAAHQRLHSSMDVSVRRGRVDIAEARAMARLTLQQKLRRQGLVEGAAKLPAHCYMDPEGVVRGPVPVPVLKPVPEESCQGPVQVESTGSGDGGNEKSSEQKEKEKVNGTVAEMIPLPRAVYGEEAGDGVLSVVQRGQAKPPEWLTRWDAGHGLAATGAPGLPLTLPGSGTGWVGCSVVSSL